MAIPVISGLNGFSAFAGVQFSVNGSNLRNQAIQGTLGGFFAANSNRIYFSGSTPHGDGYNDGTPKTGQTYDTEAPLIGPKSLKIMATGASSEASKGSNEFYWDDNVGTKLSGDVHHSWYERWRVSPWPYVIGAGGTQMKNAWYGDLGGHELFLNKDTEDIVVNGDPPDKYKITTGAGVDGGNNYTPSIPGGPIVSMRWYFMQLRTRRHGNPVTGGGPSYPAWLKVNGQTVWNLTTATGGISVPQYPTFLTNWWSTPSNFSLEKWMQSHKMANTEQYEDVLCELADSSNYATANKLRCHPLNFADSVSQFEVPTLGGLVPTHLFITNNNGERSAAWALDGGGGGGPIYRNPIAIHSANSF